jgi:hypothetical protein
LLFLFLFLSDNPSVSRTDEWLPTTSTSTQSENMTNSAKPKTVQFDELEDPIITKKQERDEDNKAMADSLRGATGTSSSQVFTFVIFP